MCNPVPLWPCLSNCKPDIYSKCCSSLPIAQVAMHSCLNAQGNLLQILYGEYCFHTSVLNFPCQPWQRQEQGNESPCKKKKYVYLSWSSGIILSTNVVIAVFFSGVQLLATCGYLRVIEQPFLMRLIVRRQQLKKVFLSVWGNNWGTSLQASCTFLCFSFAVMEDFLKSTKQNKHLQDTSDTQGYVWT